LSSIPEHTYMCARKETDTHMCVWERERKQMYHIWILL